jgi:hypothetical protein
MVESINHIGHVMGKQTIAELIESEAVVVILREIGVDGGSGGRRHESLGRNAWWARAPPFDAGVFAGCSLHLDASAVRADCPGCFSRPAGAQYSGTAVCDSRARGSARRPFDELFDSLIPGTSVFDREQQAGEDQSRADAGESGEVEERC